MEIEDNSIIAAFVLSGNRQGFVKSGCPIQVAYIDNDGLEYTLIDIGDQDECVLSPHSVLTLDENIFIGTSKGRIFRSQNRAHSWQIIEDGTISNTGCGVIQEVNEKILVGFQNGLVAYSSDKGDTWSSYPLVKWNHNE